MNTIKLFTFCCFVTSLTLSGQENNTVEIFEGRGIFNDSRVILDVSYQNLKRVPMRANNAEIEILILDHNNIEELPNWIGDLKNLKVLSIRNNKLKELNSFISYCENLEQLYLSGNKDLYDLPGLSRCENLMIIDVVGTRINEIPGSIRMMDNLLYFKYSSK